MPHPSVPLASIRIRLLEEKRFRDETRFFPAVIMPGRARIMPDGGAIQPLAGDSMPDAAAI